MHILQPKHIKVKKQEIAKLISKYNISKDQLPHIKKNDVAIAEFDPLVGDVIKITRKVGDSEEEYYRVVV